MQREVIEEAIRLLTDSGWVQGTGARNGRGEECPYDNPQASCFCLIGAIAKACLNKGITVDKAVIEYVPMFKAKLGVSPIEWNDMPGRTREDVVKFLQGYL